MDCGQKNQRLASLMVEMFSVCAKKIRIEVAFKDLTDSSKWQRGWIEIVEESS